MWLQWWEMKQYIGKSSETWATSCQSCLEPWKWTVVFVTILLFTLVGHHSRHLLLTQTVCLITFLLSLLCLHIHLGKRTKLLSWHEEFTKIFKLHWSCVPEIFWVLALHFRGRCCEIRGINPPPFSFVFPQTIAHLLAEVEVEVEVPPLPLPAARLPPALLPITPPHGPSSPPPLGSAIEPPPQFASLSLSFPVAPHRTQTRSPTPTRKQEVAPRQWRCSQLPHSLLPCLHKTSAVRGWWQTYHGPEPNKARQLSSPVL